MRRFMITLFAFLVLLVAGTWELEGTALTYDDPGDGGYWSIEDPEV